MKIARIHQIKAVLSVLTALPLAGLSASAAFAEDGGGQQNLPIRGSYIISAETLCGGGTLNTSPYGVIGFASNQAKATPATTSSYATWLSALGRSDPTNQTSYAQLGFYGNTTPPPVKETVLEWGSFDLVSFQSVASWGTNSISATPINQAGPQQFIVTRYEFPTTLDTFSTGYILYTWFPGNPLAPSATPGWTQSRVVFSNPIWNGGAPNFSASGVLPPAFGCTPNGGIQKWDGVAQQ